MRILLVGDSHGDAGFISFVVGHAMAGDCALIVQLGDFGYWEHAPWGKAFLGHCSRELVRAGISMYWIDGNHENHPLLWAKYPTGEDGFCEVRPNLFYIPRGHSWEWEGHRCLGLGGAFSIDRDWRLREEAFAGQPETLWWPTELITENNVARAKEVGAADIVFSHDCPDGVPIPGIHADDKALFPASAANRDALPGSTPSPRGVNDGAKLPISRSLVRSDPLQRHAEPANCNAVT